MPNLFGGKRGGGISAAAAQTLLTREIGEAVGVGSPLLLDQNSAFPKAESVEDFHPALLTPRSVDDLNRPLAPGDYALYVTAFCTQYSIHAPGQGLPYKLARIQGRQARPIGALIARGTLKGIPPAVLNCDAWRIQAGIPLSKWAPTDQALVHQLIPEYEQQLAGDWVAQLQQSYAGFQHIAGMPSFDVTLTRAGAAGAYVQSILKARTVLENKTLAAERVPAMLYEPQGDGLPYVLPSTPEGGSSPWAEIMPGIFARFTVIRGNMGRNLFEFRVTPQAASSAAAAAAVGAGPQPHYLTTVSFRQGATAGRGAITLARILGIIEDTAIVTGEVASSPLIGDLLIAYSTFRAAQALILMAEMYMDASTPAPGPVAPARLVDGRPVPQSHWADLGTDPATGQVQGEDADTAVRLERKLGITLQRDPQISGGGGAWSDTRSGMVYASANPPSSALFDAGWAVFLVLLTNRLQDQRVSKVAVDTTGKGLTPAQQNTLQQTLNGLTPPEKAKILRLP